MNVQVKRAYEAYSAQDGFRVLVDRLWPRGLTKEKAKIDSWLKEIAPSNELRQWFHKHPDEQKEFKKRYFEELKQRRELIHYLKREVEKHPVTLLYASKSNEFNNATVLKEYLKKK